VSGCLVQNESTEFCNRKVQSFSLYKKDLPAPKIPSATVTIVKNKTVEW